MKRIASFATLLALVAASACASDTPAQTPGAGATVPSPTVASIFAMPVTATVVRSPLATMTTEGPAPASSTATPQPIVYEEPVYMD